jgi:SAM-dependent methyltransferase
VPRTLDVGCGRNKVPGAIGIDRNPATHADALCDLNRVPYPFADSSFDEIRVVHVVEHVDDVIKLVEECHRLLRPGGWLFIVTPHYTDFASFCDPTHRWHLNSFSFRYFTEDYTFDYYSPIRFREASVRVVMPRLWRWLGLQWLINRSRAVRRLWEHYLCYIIRGKELQFWFEAVKEGEKK